MLGIQDYWGYQGFYKIGPIELLDISNTISVK